MFISLRLCYPESVSEQRGKIHWLRLTLALVGFLIVSVALGYLFQNLLAGFHISKTVPTWMAMLIIFGVLTLINLSILPLPFGASLVITAASTWNPVLVALFGSLGASCGEFSSYYIGYLGKRIALNDNVTGYKMVRNWVNRWGMWAIAFLSFQPLIPFELGGFVAGVAKMPVRKFLPALILGKFPKYLIIIYLGKEVIHLLPSLPIH